MNNAVGQGVYSIIMNIDGRDIYVMSITRASGITGYSESHLRRMCNEKELIATKYNGRWWIHSSDLKKKIVGDLPFDFKVS